MLRGEAMSALPDWLKRDVFALHTHDRAYTVFQPTKCSRVGGHLRLLDCEGTPYPLDECQLFKREDLAGEAKLVTAGAVLTLLPLPEKGLMVSDGPRRQLIECPDEGERAAQALALFFNGVVVEGGCDV
jgi:hypothetical protein